MIGVRLPSSTAGAPIRGPFVNWPRPIRGDVAQLGERRVRNAKVGSSILLVSTTNTFPLFSSGSAPCVSSMFAPKAYANNTDVDSVMKARRWTAELRRARATPPCLPRRLRPTCERLDGHIAQPCARRHHCRCGRQGRYKIARGQYKLDSRVNHQPLRCHSWHIALRARAKCRTARVPSAISALGGALSGQDLCSGSCYAFPVNLFHWNARHATNAAADAVRESVR